MSRFAVSKYIIMGLFAALAFRVWHFVHSDKSGVIAWMSSTILPFISMVCSVIWSIRNRLIDTFSDDVDDPRAFACLKHDSDLFSNKAKKLFLMTVVAAVASSTPMVTHQIGIGVWLWSLVLCFGAAGFALYAYRVANSWESQIAQKHFALKLAAKKAVQRDALKKAMGTGVVQPTKAEEATGVLTAIH